VLKVKNKIISFLVSIFNQVFPKKEFEDLIMKKRSVKMNKLLYVLEWVPFKIKAYSELHVGSCTLQGDYVNAGIWSTDLLKVNIILKNASTEYDLGLVYGIGTIYTDKRYDIPRGSYDIYIRTKEGKVTGKAAIYDGTI
jgi:hypothetical protein